MANDYSHARRLGLRAYRADVAAGRYPYPPALDDMLEGTGSQGTRSLGVMEIPLDCVAGTRTRGRQSALASNFMPLLEQGSEFATKWSALACAYAEQGFREPVVVYEYLQRFYVQEGNKRVSVALFYGAKSIAARVERVIPMASDEDAFCLYRAFEKFWQGCAVYGIVANDPESFAGIARAFGYALGERWEDRDVLALKALLARFHAAWNKSKIAGDSLGEGDALAFYVRVLGRDRACALTMDQTEAAVLRLKPEFELNATGEVPAHLEEPPEVRGSISRAFSAPVSVREPLNVAFLFDDDPQVSSWDASHEEGRAGAQRQMTDQLQTRCWYECDSAVSYARAVDEAACWGAHVVVSLGASQLEYARRAAVEYPDVVFYIASLTGAATVRGFGTRGYEAKYLLGMVAGAMTASHEIGYVLDRGEGAISEMNAFALGAAAVDAHARICACSSADQLAAFARDRALDMACLSNFADPFNPRVGWGLVRVDAAGRFSQVAWPEWHWDRYYALLFRAVREDVLHGDHTEARGIEPALWWGMSSGVIDVGLDEDVPTGVQGLIAMARQALKGHQLEPFAGELVSLTGMVQPQGSGRLSAADIVGMQWVNSNIDCSNASGTAFDNHNGNHGGMASIDARLQGGAGR